MKEETIKQQVEDKINCIIDEGIEMNNLDALGKLVDIHKDISNEEYWNKKKEAMNMNYRMHDYDYNRDRERYGRRMRDSRGRYMRRGVDAKYRGEETIDDMYRGYREYSDGREEYNRGNYGAKSNTMKSLDYMMQSVVDFIEMLQDDASSQEEVELIQKYTRQISEM